MTGKYDLQPKEIHVIKMYECIFLIMKTAYYLRGIL